MEDNKLSATLQLKKILGTYSLLDFVCGCLPFDSNNLAELRKRILSGQYRVPFYLSPG